MHPWWLFVKAGPIYFHKVARVMSVLMGGQPSKYQRNFDCITCKMCAGFFYESPMHILFECEALKHYRSTLWHVILSEMTDPLKQSINCMSCTEKVKFLLSCCNESYTKEWKNLYKAIADFVHKMYVYRAALYDAMS